jgi:hypothetical protein
MKRNKIFLNLFFIGLFFSSTSFSQNAVKITGRAYDKANKNLPLPRLMIINKRTNQGIFADEESKFALTILPADTIIFSAIGYKVKTVCFYDSVIKKQYYYEVALQKLELTLPEVSVFADRNLNEIQRDIDRLGVSKRYSTEGVDAVSSPVTALYERFSKIEKSKRRVAEWENEDLKKDILRDLLHMYVKYEIIDLQDDEFDAFIKYLNLSDDFIRNSTQFELITAIKGRYESFKYRWK